MAWLTKQQRKVIKLIFVDSMSLSEIALKLGISKSSVQTQKERALKKLKRRHANSLLVKGKKIIKESRPSTSETKKLKQFKAEVKDIDPYLYYSKCPKCSGNDLTGKKNMGKCLSCGWGFSVHSVEDVQDSHPWPDKPILDGSNY
jgi:predicted DNA-binding protein YlxM (UPF0122 family)